MSYRIRSWKLSYYQNDLRRWVIGQLTCSPFAVTFKADTTDSPAEPSTSSSDHDCGPKAETDPERESADLLVEYTDIKQIQKARSMLIFSAVTLETCDGTVHWFSSLPDAHSVYNILHHFTLYSVKGGTDSVAKKGSTDPASQTRLGQQLLQSAEDSEQTLAAAAGELHGQGRKLAGASIQLQEIHEDLDVADRLLSGLNTYLGQWRLPPQYMQVEPVHVSKDDVPSDQDLEVLSSQLSKDQWCSQQLCILRVTESGLALLTTRQSLLHTLRWMELSRVFIVSPWEVVLTKHVAGKADVSVSVVSASLLPVLQVLQKRVPHLVDYQAVPTHVVKPATVTAEDTTGSSKTTCSTAHTAACLHQNPKPRSTSTGIDGSTGAPAASIQLQQGKQQEVLSEAELLALQSKLGGLKMMAAAVGEELTSQNEVLDDMIESVDRADSRIRDATQRIKRLM